MNYCWILLILGLAVGAKGLTGRGVVYPGRSDLFELSILHINDFHARFEEVGPRAGICQKGERCIGGLPRVLSAVKELLAQRPNSIFLNAGDHYQGTLWYNVHRWNATAFFLNLLPHDAMTIGNHEFDDRVEGLVPFLKVIEAPVVVSNIDMTHEPSMQNLTKSSVILHRGGRKIGVIGVILKTTPMISNTGRLIFLDEVESVNAEAEKLKRIDGVDIIVVLSHCGLDVDRRMAAECPLVDVIVGGHSHTFLYSGEQLPFNDYPEDEYPVVVDQKESNRTVLIVQALAFTKYLGNLTVWFNDEGEIEDWEGNPILLDESYEQDPDMLEALKPWKIPVDKLGSKVLGQTTVDLISNCKRGECNLGNLVTDAMIESYINEPSEPDSWTIASIAVMNGGGIRSSITSLSGDVTYGDLIMAQPFENTWDIVEIQGKYIRQTLEYTVSMSESREKWNGYPFLVWSGLKVSYDMSRKPFARVVDVKVNCRKCLVPTYEDLVDDSWYKVVMPSFLVDGGDGHSIVAKNYRNRTIGFKDIDYLAKFVNRMSPLVYGTEGRINFV